MICFCKYTFFWRNYLPFRFKKSPFRAQLPTGEKRKKETFDGRMLEMRAKNGRTNSQIRYLVVSLSQIRTVFFFVFCAFIPRFFERKAAIATQTVQR
jgi:hypothetical protein